ncbi:hypothetical protein [Actinomyces bowdenii]|uniref:ApeA N-terminal domain-containing protein n=1 Tax=Actinomyces bowdenii TaxID=131109 RepID=A0A3P1UQ98_9ACTO|nr:hypothetical protein [Actinomyces bowdenii]RRD23355.1 hypothetical protein EII10_12025 [Actinomyces bowdenii]
MSANELIVGEPRLGWLIDDNQNTPHVAVMLLDTGNAIELTVPLKGTFKEDDPYARWFMPNYTEYGDDPGRTEYTYAPPRNLLFTDGYGVVVLVDCRTGSSLVKMAGPMGGHGKIIANYAVLGGHSLDYDTLNGLQTESPGVTAWSRLGDVNVIQGREETTKTLVSETVELGVPGVLDISKTMNLTLEPMLKHHKEDSHVTVRNSVTVRTFVTEPVDWETHLETHTAVLDLASISAWRPFGFSEVRVHRGDGSERSAGDTALRDRWAKVATHRLWEHKAWTKRLRFLFPYEEVGASGIDDWLNLRRDYKEALDSLIGILRSDEPWSRASIIQSGVMLETLGYLIDTIKLESREQSKSKADGKRGQISFNCALRLVLDDMVIKPFKFVHSGGRIEPMEEENWIKETNRIYMGLKHYDRRASDPLDSLDSLNSMKMNLQVMRCWVALQLGISPKTLEENLKHDPLSNKFVKEG